jgi:hypothetical protein
MMDSIGLIGIVIGVFLIALGFFEAQHTRRF